jgi:hypothetical protein
MIKELVKIFPLEHCAIEDAIEVSEIIVLKDDEVVPEGHCCFRILSHKGDERLVWDSRSLIQLNEAKNVFNQLIQKGLVPHRVGVNGDATAEIMTEFDPHSEEVIFLPIRAVAGG